MSIPGDTSLPGRKVVISISSSILLEVTGNIGSTCSGSTFAKYSLTFDAHSSFIQSVIQHFSELELTILASYALPRAMRKNWKCLSCNISEDHSGTLLVLQGG